ncbi:hypothetical protein CDAR_100432 [Caerostris darwini]|uniref:Uncharacterized protein n=1 Tax=Caerostris darwini TaxID=1538125 RepID=A0AAV4X5L4_9ARAC|nr:hypothetical protein CDAR_100432 [Caerostris darwini]
MGTCFGCFTKKNMRNPSSRRKFFRIGKSQEYLFSFVYHLLPQDEEEFLELEQRAENAAQTPTSAKEGASEKTKPAKLTFKKANFGWLKNDNEMLSGALHHLKNMKSPADSVMPLLNRENSFADTCSNTGSQKWDQLSTGATPGSSVDLEWENEIGFNSSNFGATEELQWTVLTENTNNSYRSSPLSNSNGLEWDGDFTSVDVSEIVAETQRLTSELDDNSIQESTNNKIRDIENNY